MKSTMMELMYQGGWMMWVLLALSIAAVAVGAERLIVLWRARRASRRFVDRFRAELGTAPSAKGLLKLAQESEGPTARVAQAGLRRFGGSPAQLEATLERHGNREARLLSRRLGILASVAASAPLLGFLGTVAGMMIAFQGISVGHANPELVAVGIYEALTTTAAGLAVAVPTQLVHNALVGWLGRLEGEIEDVANALLELRA